MSVGKEIRVQNMITKHRQIPCHYSGVPKALHMSQMAESFGKICPTGMVGIMVHQYLLERTEKKFIHLIIYFLDINQLQNPFNELYTSKHLTA